MLSSCWRPSANRRRWTIEALQRTSTGRLKRVVVRGPDGEIELPARELRRRLKLKSTYVRFEPPQPSNDALGALDDWLNPSVEPQPQLIAKGRGFGHGVGMSQWGAYGLSLKGKGYAAIFFALLPRSQAGFYQALRLAQTSSAAVTAFFQLVQYDDPAALMQACSHTSSSVCNSAYPVHPRPLGLATGRTMEPLYGALVARLLRWPQAQLDHLRRHRLSFNLDDYVGLRAGIPGVRRLHAEAFGSTPWSWPPAFAC